MKFKFISLFLVSLIVLPFVASGCQDNDLANPDVNTDVEVNTPDNPKGKNFRKSNQAG